MSQELTAYAPNGKKITHEFWLRPYTSPVEFVRDEEVADYGDGYVAPGISAQADYSANEELDIEYRTEYEHDLAGNKRERVLRYMDEDGGLWASEDLTFKEDV